MKLRLFVPIFAFAATAQAKALHLRCEPLNAHQTLAFRADQRILTQLGQRSVKLAGVFERQTLTSSLNPVTQQIQFLLQLPSQQTKTLVKVTSAQEAANVWDHLRTQVRSTGFLPFVLPSRVAEEYARYVSFKSSKDVYLMLLTSEGEASYAGFCNLQIR